MLVKAGDEPGKGDAILGVADDETIESFRDDLRAAIVDAGDHRKAASHSFNRRQSKRIVERGPRVNVCGGVELHDVGRASVEKHAAVQVEESNLFQERSAIVAAHDEQAEGKVLQRGDRVQERCQPLTFPIVADQEQNEFGFRKLQNFAGLFTPAKAFGRVKTRQINCVGNHGDILPGKMRGKLARRPVRNSCQIDPRIAVDAVFQSHDKAVIQNAVEQQRPSGERSVPQSHVLMYQPEKLMKNDMDYNRARITAIDPRGKNQVEAKPPKLLVKPAESLIGKVPPEKIQQMRPRQGGNPVPDRFSCSWR